MKIRGNKKGINAKLLIVIGALVLALICVVVAVVVVPKISGEKPDKNEGKTTTTTTTATTTTTTTTDDSNPPDDVPTKPDYSQKPGVIQGITMSVLPKTTYYVGEALDLSSGKIQIIKDIQEGTYFLDLSDEDVEISGFDSSAAAVDQVITVTYQGFTTTFKVNIKEIPVVQEKPTLVSIEVVDLISTYTVEKWNLNGLNPYGAYLKLTYSDGTVKGSYAETPLLWSYVDPISKVDGPGTTEITVSYIEAGVKVSTVVTITITE